MRKKPSQTALDKQHHTTTSQVHGHKGICAILCCSSWEDVAYMACGPEGRGHLGGH